MNYKLNTHLLDNFFDTFGTHKGADVKDCGDVYTAEFELAGWVCVSNLSQLALPRAPI